MKRGTIVLTPFPFSDLKGTKRRPAVIISRDSITKDDVIVAFITSIIPQKFSDTDLIFDLSRKDFNKSGLKKKSINELPRRKQRGIFYSLKESKLICFM